MDLGAIAVKAVVVLVMVADYVATLTASSTEPGCCEGAMG
jgi:hypothetical protein